MTKNPATVSPLSSSEDALLVQSLRSRAKWPWVRDYLKGKNLKPGSGWADIASALGDAKGAHEIRTLLKDFYRAVMIAGNKYVELFELDDSVRQPLNQALSTGSVPPSVFLERYPFCLDHGSLKTVPSELVLCELRQLEDNDVALVFCSRQDYMEREIFEGEAAKAITKSVPALEDFQSIVALRSRSFQAFDVVVVRSALKRIEVMVDLPFEHSFGLDKSDRVLKILAAASIHLPLLKEFGAGRQKLNLFSAIAGMYRDPKGGILQAIKVRTSTGLVDHLRTTVSSDDLRNNKYHTASATAVNNEIDPFEITTRLDLSMPAASVTVRLAAHVAMLGAPPDARWLHGIEILDCYSQRDAVRAINRVVSFAT